MRLGGGVAVTANGLTGRLYSSNAASAAGQPAYVLLHGIGVSHRYLARLHAELARDAAVYSFDLPGFGGTPRPCRQVSVGEYAAFVAAVMVQRGLESCTVVGHSMGVQFAVELALQAPALVSRTVLMGPVVDPARRSAAWHALALQRALDGGTDITVFVDGTVHRLPPQARDAVVDLLARFSRGEAVSVSSVEEMLTTSQAAELAGISHTYLRNMTDRGEIPVEYRGTHRRIRLAAIMAWLEGQKKKQAAENSDGGTSDGGNGK